MDTTNLTLTSYSRAPVTTSPGLENWKDRINAPDVSSESRSMLKSGVLAWADFGDAKTDYHENPRIQHVMDKYDLKNKDWDFTLDKSGNIEVLVGDDELSKSAIKELEQALNGSEFGYRFKSMAENLIYQSHDSRYSMGKYNVTTDNIGDILKGRELMNTKRSDYNDLAGTFSNQIDRVVESQGLEERERFIVKNIKIEA